MSSQVDTSMPRSYTDFTGLGELRGKAQKDQNSALRESAQQFEGLFIQMMLKSMREANAPMKDEDNHSQAMETFEGMFDKEVSLQMSKRGALGVADFMERAVKQQQMPAPSTDALLKARQRYPIESQATSYSFAHSGRVEQRLCFGEGIASQELERIQSPHDWRP